MPWGSIVSAAIGAGSSLLGGYMSNRANAQANQFNIEWARESQKKDQDFQREVYQNQYQWKAADAKKAGLHPLAIIGGGSYSASPTSQPVNVQPDDYSFIGKMGDQIGDAYNAYKTREAQAAQAAKEDQRAEEQHDANMRESAARTLMYNGQALEATRRAASYSVPMASGLESIPGQVQARPTKSFMSDINKFAWPRNPDGSRSDPIPSSEYREIYEDVPFLEFLPFIDAGYHKWRSILTGRPIDGYRHNWRNNSWSR